jgi:hypothetical protein
MSVWILAVCLALGPAAAQPADDDDSAAPGPASERTNDVESQLYWLALQDLAGRIQGLEASRGSMKLAADATDVEDARAALLAQVQLMEDQVVAAREEMARLVSGQAPRDVAERAQQHSDWNTELNELMAPVVSQLKQATERPRRLEQLRGEVLNLDFRIEAVEGAIRDTVHAVDEAPTAAAKAELKHLLDSWNDAGDGLRKQRRIKQRQLETVQARRVGIGGSLEAVGRLVFGGRGQTVAWAGLAFALVLLVVRLLHGLLLAAVLQGRRERVSARLAELVLYAFGGALASLAGLGVLFASGDWVLLTAALLLLFGVVLTMRRGFPRFAAEIRVLLNIGAVREGERLIWEGIPWRIDRLSLQTILVNPEFPDTLIRVPVRALVNVSSRPVSETEQWFPTRIGDWVLWDDIAAQVEFQGPEAVRLNWDRSQLTIPTADFLASAPRNLSRGFRHRVVLTLDYKHQDIATSVVPDGLRKHVRKALEAAGIDDSLLGINVAFEAASASSLDIEAEVDFDGAAANRWEDLAEIIQAAVVDACNVEGWEIALPQLTLHQAGSGSAGAMEKPVNP